MGGAGAGPSAGVVVREGLASWPSPRPRSPDPPPEAVARGGCGRDTAPGALGGTTGDRAFGENPLLSTAPLPCPLSANRSLPTNRTRRPSLLTSGEREQLAP